MTRMNLWKRIARTTAQIEDLGRKAQGKVWQRAEDLYAAMQTYPAGTEGYAAFLAAAAAPENGGIAEAVVKQAISAVEFRNGLTAKQREAVADWPLGKVITLKGKLTTGQTTKLIEQGQTLNEKDLRTAKRKLSGTTKRSRQTAAEQTTKLAEQIREAVEKLLAKDHDPVTLAAGAQLAREYSGDVAAAILFVATNVKQADSVV